MVFGEKSSFAVEAMSEPALLAPSAVWGRMRIWCQGHPLGDYSEENCGLYHAYGELKSLLTFVPELWSDRFVDLSDIELFDLLDDLLYGYKGGIEIGVDRSIEQCQADWNVYGKHSFLVNWGEQFDRAGKSFIFCEDNHLVKILNRPSPIQEVLALHAPITDFRNSIQQFSAWFEQERVRLHG